MQLAPLSKREHSKNSKSLPAMEIGYDVLMLRGTKLQSQIQKRKSRQKRFVRTREGKPCLPDQGEKDGNLSCFAAPPWSRRHLASVAGGSSETGARKARGDGDRALPQASGAG
jgi:hypothetical protein